VQRGKTVVPQPFFGYKSSAAKEIKDKVTKALSGAFFAGATERGWL